MFKSLKLKLLAYFVVANSIILLGFSVFIYNTAQKGVSDSLDTMLKIISIDALPDLKNKGHINAKDVADELVYEFGIAPLYVKIIYYDKNTHKIEHETIFTEGFSNLFQIPLNIDAKLHDVEYFDKETLRVSSMLLLENENKKIFFQLATKKIVDSPYLQEITLSLIIANPVILLLFLLIANILINRTLQPVKEVVYSVRNISSNNLVDRINNKNIPTEIEELVQTFNQLLDNLEESFSRITSFSSDASHELKTPLTVIRGEIEVALRKNRTQEEYKNILQDLLSETLRVQETIEQLFLITKKDTVELHSNFEDVYLDELILDTIAEIKKLSDERSIYIKMDNIIPVTIHANEALLKIVIVNILRNAIIYSPELSQVKIYVEEDTSFYTLIIEDSGCGISEKDIPFIFDRFYRADKVRSRKDNGTGLGLSIVKMIIDIHHFEIIFQSIIDEGTKVIIKIPK